MTTEPPRPRSIRVIVCAPVLLALGLAGAAAAPASAQPWRASILALPGVVPILADSTRAAPAPVPTPLVAPPPPLRQPSIGVPVFAGLLAAAAGASIGALIGDATDQGSSGDFIPEGAAWGFLIGEATVLPVGVHLGNARKGWFAPDLGASLIGALAALGAGALSNNGSVYLAGIGAQLGLTVWAERDGARRRQREAEDSYRESAHGVSMPAPPPEPDPLVPPPPPTK